MPRTHPIPIIAAIVLAVIIGGLWATQGQKSQEEHLEKATIGVARQPIASLVVIAQQQEYFAEEGLDVTLNRYTIGRNALDDVFAGKNDLATVADTPIVFQSFERQDFDIVATVGSDSLMGVIARRDRGIQTPTDLRGKRVAVTKGTAPHFFLHSFLLENGISTEDIKLSFKDADELPRALESGEIDAFATIEPVLSETKRSLGSNAVVLGDSQIYQRTFHLVTLEDSVERDPLLIQRVIRALIRAEDFVEEHPDQAVKVIADELDIDEADLRSQWPDLLFRVSLEQSSLIQLEDQARWAIESGLTDATTVPNYLEYIDANALEAVDPTRVNIIS